MKHYIYKTVKVIFPFVLGGGILYWMYRGFPFSRISDVLLHQMKWSWMLLSFIPGILAQVFRALRWRQSLLPLGERPRMSDCIHAVYLSYATSLVIPRVGEFLRCGVLARHDGTSFPKALGTVVTERAVDSILVLLLNAVVFFMQLPVFMSFFDITGVNFQSLFLRFTPTGIFVTVLCIICIIGLVLILFRKLSFMRKVRSVMHGLMEGILSLKNIRNIPLYAFYSVGIWVAYFFHYYLTFYCFSATEHLGLMAGLVSFCVGTIAVIVPTPNGAGSWHFAVKTVLVLYGLGTGAAVVFVLIVHSVQTLLLVALGVYAWVALQIQTPVGKYIKIDEP